MTTPSEDLTKIVFEKLLQEGLLTAEDAEKLLEKASCGKMRTEDWRLAIEKSGEQEGVDE
jgi:hypothetical protein